MLRAGAIAIGAVAAIAAARPAGANEHLERARAELVRVELESAARSLDQALAAGDNDPAELAEIYRLGGQVAAALGDEAEAVRRFEHLLALAPDAALVGVAPKIARPFERARKAAAARKPLRARHEIVTSPRRAIAIHIESDPLAMVAEARATDIERGTVQRSSGAGPFDLALSGRAEQRLVATLHDRHGNTLLQIGSRDVPIVVAAAPAPEAAPAASRPSVAVPTSPRDEADDTPIPLRWYLWSGGAAVAAGVGTYFGLESRSAQDELDQLNRDSDAHSFDEALELEDRWRSRARAANIGFAVAGGLATVAAILFVKGRIRARKGRAERARALVTPTADGGTSAILEFSF